MTDHIRQLEQELAAIKAERDEYVRRWRDLEVTYWSMPIELATNHDAIARTVLLAIRGLDDENLGVNLPDGLREQLDQALKGLAPCRES